MTDLELRGPLNLMGPLDLASTVMIAGAEALVQDDTGTAPPVLQPPVAPIDPDPKVTIVLSFNQHVTACGKAIVALGIVMQGKQWPGMMLPSGSNTQVTINQIPINVSGDRAIVFPSGGSASFSKPV